MTAHHQSPQNSSTDNPKDLREGIGTRDEFSNWLVPLQSADEPMDFGGKAVPLSRLINRGVSVPEGLVLSAQALQSYIEHNDLDRFIDRSLRCLDPTDHQSLEEASSEIEQQIQAGDFPELWTEQLERVLVKRPTHDDWAIRSSGIGEDGFDSAFAGQLHTELNVPHDIPSIVNAIKSCWAAAWSTRSLFYQTARGVSLTGVALIIQEQIEARWSGVLFTRHPTDTENDDCQLEFCSGAGEALVSGKVTPRRVTLSRSAQELTTDNASEPAEVDVELAANIKGLVLESIAVEKEWGYPLDVEWCVDKQANVYWLQARPITTLQQPSAKSTTRWSNVNVNENYPEPLCVPLTDIAPRAYYHYFKNLGRAFGIPTQRIARVEGALQEIAGVQGGRLYYNLTNIDRVLSAAPFSDFLKQAFDAFVGSSPTRLHDDQMPTRLADSLLTIRMSLRCTSLFRSLNKRLERFEKEVDNFGKRTTQDVLRTQGIEELTEHLSRFKTIRDGQWLEPSLADASAMISYGLLKRFLESELPTDEAQTQLHQQLIGLQDVVSGRPAFELWNLANRVRGSKQLRDWLENASETDLQPQEHERSNQRDNGCRNEVPAEAADFAKEFQGYLQKWGFRCSGELMLTRPTLQEQPALVKQTILSYASASEYDPLSRIENQTIERKSATQGMVSRLRGKRFRRFLFWPRKSTVFCWLSAWAQHSVMLRERARMKQALLYTRLRYVLLECGRRLSERGVLVEQHDVFFLTLDEVADALMVESENLDIIRRRITRRKRLHEKWSGIRPPTEISLPDGVNWTPSMSPPAAPIVKQRHEARVGKPNDAASRTRFRTGTSACGGKVIGRAVVLDDIQQIGDIQPGDILVARQTDPGWGPAFLLIQGLVMERGGMLSHGAILAREYGLPTVVDLPGITDQLETGQTIEVDGDSGRIQVVS